MVKTIATVLIATGWLIYGGLTGYVLWLIITGRTPSFLKDYTLGTNAAWVTIGLLLWVATEWLREFREGS